MNSNTRQKRFSRLQTNLLAACLSLIVLLQPCAAFPTGSVTEVAGANPLAGSYRGSLTGTINGAGVYNRAVVAEVNQSGRLTLTVPGLGTGTVTANGQCRATLRFEVNGRTLEALFAGSIVAVRSPSTGKVLSVVGVGTWRITTPGQKGGGKWFIRQPAPGN